MRSDFSLNTTSDGCEPKSNAVRSVVLDADDLG